MQLTKIDTAASHPHMCIIYTSIMMKYMYIHVHVRKFHQGLIHVHVYVAMVAHSIHDNMYIV